MASLKSAIGVLLVRLTTVPSDLWVYLANRDPHAIPLHCILEKLIG